MVEYQLTPEKIATSIKRAMELLITYRAPYQGMVVAHVTDGAATKIYQASPRMVVFTSEDGVERIAQGERETVMSSTMPWLEYFRMPRGYDKTVTIDSLLQFVGKP